MNKKLEIFWFASLSAFFVIGFGMSFSQNSLVELIGKIFGWIALFLLITYNFIQFYFFVRNKKKTANRTKNVEVSEDNESNEKD